MIQGTMSNAGKSLLCAGLCRIFKQDGYRVAPFKSQNMALNSFITEDGLEMGRAQVVQAEAAGVAPQVEMNPILLKPTNDVGSQVIVNGEVLKNMSAREYFAYKKQLIPGLGSEILQKIRNNFLLHSHQTILKTETLHKTKVRSPHRSMEKNTLHTIYFHLSIRCAASESCCT